MAALLLAASMASGTDVLPALTEYYVELVGMTIGAPSEAFVTDSRVSSSFEPLERYGMTAAELELRYKKAGICFNALWFPEDTDMTEIVVTVHEDKESRELFDLSAVDEYALKRLCKSYEGYMTGHTGVNALYTEATCCKNEQLVFIRASGAMISDAVRENHLQYMTVVNGRRYEFTLIEHLSGADEERLCVSEENARLMDAVMQTVRFDRVEGEFLAKNRRFVVVVAACAVACAAMLCYVTVKRARVKKRMKGAQALSDE